MSDLLDVLRLAVEVADEVTKPLQATVEYRRFVGNDVFGARVYSPDVSLPALELHAIVDFASVQVRTREGALTVTRATIELLNIAEVLAATSGNGIGNDDVFVLPDGDTGPILDLGGFIDAGTGNPVATRVMIG